MINVQYWLYQYWHSFFLLEEKKSLYKVRHLDVPKGEPNRMTRRCQSPGGAGFDEYASYKEGQETSSLKKNSLLISKTN